MGSYEPLLHFRLKSERRRKRLQKEDFEKKLIKLHREEKKLSKQIDNLGYEPLIPTYQSGWKRTFVLREDLKKQATAAFFEALLKKINTVEYSDRKDFTKKGRKRGRKIRVPRVQKLRFFYDYEQCFKRFTEHELFYFRENIVIIRKNTYSKIYEFIEPWRFVLKVFPNMITEVKIKDGLLEQRKAEIDNYFDRNHLFPRLFKMLNGAYQYKGDLQKDKLKYKNPFYNKPLYQVLNELT
jgi:hypothetical protein